MISSGEIDIDAYEGSEVGCAGMDANAASISIIPAAYSVRPLTL